MSITTFAELIVTPDTQKVVLAEIVVGEDLIGETWTQQSSPNDNAWRLSYLHETITLTDSSTSLITKTVTAVKADSTALSIQSSIADVHANANSFWHDTSTGNLYVNVGGNPSTTVELLLVNFTLYFADEGKDLNSVYYEPRISAVPNITQETNGLIAGFSTIGAGNLSLSNADGFFNIIFDKFVWENNTVTIKLGGEDLPYGEYTAISTLQVYNKFWSEIEFTLDLRDKMNALLRSIPETIFNLTDNPNADPNIIGQPVPIGHGRFGQDDIVTDSGGRTAPVLFASDETNKSDGNGNKVVHDIADHTVFEADAAWISPDRGSTWYILSEQSPNTDAPDAAGKWGSYDDTGTIGDASDNSSITVKFAVDGTEPISASTVPYVQGQTKIKLAFKGRENSDTTEMVSLADQVQDYIVTFNGRPSSDLKASSFSDSKNASDNTASNYINKVTRTIDIIDEFLRSEPAKFFVDGDGKYNYVVLDPDVDVTAPTVDRKDLLEFTGMVDQEEHFTKVKVGHQQSSINQNYLYELARDTVAENKFDNKKQKLIQTRLDNSSDANVLGERQLFIRKRPVTIISGKTKLQLIAKNVGDKINITSSRAPIDNPDGYVGRQFELTRVVKDLGNYKTSFEAVDLNNLGGEIGHWTDDAAPDWSAATDTQKQQQGFWSDVNGFIDPLDGASKNQSLWF